MIVSVESDPGEVDAVATLAKKKGLTAVSLPMWCEIPWSLVDDKGLIKHWVHFMRADKIDQNLPVDLHTWRAGLSLYKDTAASFMLVVACGSETYYLAAPLATWEFGIDQESLEPTAYVQARFLVNSTQVESPT